MPELDSVPFFNQLAGGTTDADGRNENAANNCMATSIAIVMARTYGYQAFADEVKDWMRGDAYIGNLFVNPDAVKYLTQRADIPVDVYHEQRPHDIRQVITDAINSDWPVCVLFKSPIGVNSRMVNHFAVVYGYDDEGLWMSDPWLAQRKVYTWDYFQSVYLGWSLVCQRGRDAWLNQGTRDIRSYDDIPVGGEAGMTEDEAQ